MKARLVGPPLSDSEGGFCGSSRPSEYRISTRGVGPYLQGSQRPSWGQALWPLRILLDPDWLKRYFPKTLGIPITWGGRTRFGTPAFPILLGPFPGGLCPLRGVMETLRPPRRRLCLKKEK